MAKIVTVFLQMSSTAHPGIEKLLLSEVREVESAVAVPVFPLSDLVPGDLTEVFRYSGSLTTPPCSQIVEGRLSEAERGRQEAEQRSRRELETIVTGLQRELEERDAMIASMSLSSVTSSAITSPFVMSPDNGSPGDSPGSTTPPTGQ